MYAEALIEFAVPMVHARELASDPRRLELTVDRMANHVPASAKFFLNEHAKNARGSSGGATGGGAADGGDAAHGGGGGGGEHHRRSADDDDDDDDDDDATVAPRTVRHRLRHAEYVDTSSRRVLFLFFFSPVGRKREATRWAAA